MDSAARRRVHVPRLLPPRLSLVQSPQWSSRVSAANADTQERFHLRDYGFGCFGGPKTVN